MKWKDAVVIISWFWDLGGMNDVENNKYSFSMVMTMELETRGLSGGETEQQVDDKCEIIKIFLIITNFLDYYPKSLPEWTFPRLLLSASPTRSWYTVVVLMIVISSAAHPAPHPYFKFKRERAICGLWYILWCKDFQFSMFNMKKSDATHAIANLLPSDPNGMAKENWLKLRSIIRNSTVFLI